MRAMTRLSENRAVSKVGSRSALARANDSVSACCSAENSSKRPAGPTARRAGRLSLAEREALILDATERLLAQKGLVGASMAAIAREAGMSKRTLYAVFASRELLFEALVRRTSEMFFRPLDQAERRRPLAWRLGRLLEPDGRESVWQAPAIILRAIVAEASSHPELARLVLRDGFDTCRRLVEAELARAHEAGEFGFADCRAAAHLLCDMAYGCPLEQLLDPSRSPPTPRERRARLDLAIRVFLAGFGADRCVGEAAVSSAAGA